MTPLELSKSSERVIREARDVSELWTGTLIADTIDAKIEVLVKALNNGEAERVEDILLPTLTKDIDHARNIYQQQEEMGEEW